MIHFKYRGHTKIHLYQITQQNTSYPGDCQGLERLNIPYSHGDTCTSCLEHTPFFRPTLIMQSSVAPWEITSSCQHTPLFIPHIFEYRSHSHTSRTYNLGPTLTDCCPLTGFPHFHSNKIPGHFQDISGHILTFPGHQNTA